MLFVTNGDSAADRIRHLGLADEILPWRDVLHEGPVPPGLSCGEMREVRARFVAQQGWGDFDEVIGDFVRRDIALDGFRDHEEVVLWFEHDLYDQLQLIQLLDYFEGRDLAKTRLTMVRADDYLGTLVPESLRAHFSDRREVSEQVLGLGHRAWLSFTSADPGRVSGLLGEDTTGLPFLQGALVRHLEQFPSVQTGLSRSETQLMGAILEGESVLREAFVASQDLEERVFLGDSVFATYVVSLSATGEPLLLFEDGARIAVPNDPDSLNRFWESKAVVTEVGRAVLDGRVDRIALSPIDRWLGGVHLEGNEVRWRWDEASRKLVRSPEP